MGAYKCVWMSGTWDRGRGGSPAKISREDEGREDERRKGLHGSTRRLVGHVVETSDGPPLVHLPQQDHDGRVR